MNQADGPGVHYARLPRNVLPDRYELEITPDLEQARFTGTMAADVRVIEPVTQFVLNAKDLEVDDVHLTLEADRVVTGTVSYRRDDEQVVLTWPAEVPPGGATLTLHFTGTLNDQLAGLYRSTYQDAEGNRVVLAATQFEAADARRAFPCWDEPDLKATFAISLVVDEGLTALSNGPEVASVAVGDEKRRVTFAETMRMSTYLVAMVVGALEVGDPIDVEGVPVRIIARPGQSHRTAFAQVAARHALQFFHAYFGIPYPAPKLDHAAIPDFAAGAMENLGLVLYRETALLVDPERAAESDRQGVLSVVAHETAHMWFGDLVTMRWWNGIWLNEAFATFMQLLATDAFEPRWEVWTEFGRSRAAALRTDGLASTRPVENPVVRVEDAMSMNGVLTYSKGGAVLRMIEQYLGADVFQAGISAYLTRHQYGNTETSDLWDALEAQSGEPARAVMDSWVTQGGYPLVRAEVRGDTLVLSQRRFQYLGAADDRTWQVPVVIGVRAADGRQDTLRVVLGAEGVSVPLPPGWAWLTVNEGAWGFYRVAYDDTLWQGLMDHVGELEARERVALADDAWAGALAGRMPLSQVLSLWRALGSDRDPDVWGTMADGMALLALVGDEADRQALAAFVREIGQPVLEELTWDPDPHEGVRATQLRARIVQLLGTVGEDGRVRAEALARFSADATSHKAIAPDLLMAVLQVVAAAGGEEEWERVLHRFQSDPSVQAQVRYLYNLSGFADPALVRRTVALYLSDAVRTQDSLGVLARALGQPHASGAVWEALEQQWDALQTKYPPMAVGYLLSELSRVVDEELAERIGTWLGSHPVGPAATVVDQAREMQAVHLAFRRRVRGHLAELMGASH